MRTARQVAKWRKSIHRTQSVRPCIVTIGTDTYEGASYECVGEFIPNMDAIVRGERRQVTCTSSGRCTSSAKCPPS